ncbi:MAG: hypothetical protein WBZ29_05355 [Methanocella sp.]
MVKVRVRTYCKHCGRNEIVETERDVDGALAGDIHCRQCGNITVGEIDEV